MTGPGLPVYGRAMICPGRRGSAVAVLALAAVLAVAVTVAGPPEAPAALPGVNGSIAFTDPEQGIVVMGAGGENPTIVSGNTDDELPSFSPDGTKITFVNPWAGVPPGEMEELPFGEPGTNGLWVMDADGENRQRLLDPGDDDLEDPVFSPDGARIAFTRDVGGGAPYSPEIHVIDVDGGNERVLSRPRQVAGSMEYDGDPAWSPDGSMIAVERFGSEARTGIWVIGADGQGETQITSQAADPARAADSDPDWSPDGSRLVVRAQAPGQEGDIHVIDADGRNRRVLTNDPVDENHPVFSPDGSLIAFIRADPPPPPEPGDLEGEIWGGTTGDVWVMATDGSGQRNLTGTLEDAELSPTWQPRPPAGAATGSGPDVGNVPAPDTTAPVISDVALSPLRFRVSARLTAPTGVAARRRRARSATIRYRLSESASAKLHVVRMVRGIRVTRQGRAGCVRLTTLTRREALALIRRRLGARATGPAGRRRIARAFRRARCTVARPAASFARRSGPGLNRAAFTSRIGRRRLTPGTYRLRVGAIDAAGNLARARLSRSFRIVR